MPPTSKRISKYVKYTTEELDSYKNVDACVKKMSANLHLNILPFNLTDFKKSLLDLLSRKKVGSYDDKMEGIILDIHNVKLISSSGAIRFDDPKIHLDVLSDCYIFKPTIGAIVRGVVRHVSSTQIGVIIYRVFSVSIRLVNKPNVKLEVDSEIEFKIKQFDLEHTYPYIEGELVESTAVENTLERAQQEVEEPVDIKGGIKLIEEIIDYQSDDCKILSPSKPKKRKKEISFKTE